MFYCIEEETNQASAFLAVAKESTAKPTASLYPTIGGFAFFRRMHILI